MEAIRKHNRFSMLSVAMIPVSIVGSVAFSLIFLSAPIGIVSGIVAVKRGDKILGTTGAVINALLIAILLTLWAMAATSKGD